MEIRLQHLPPTPSKRNYTHCTLGRDRKNRRKNKATYLLNPKASMKRRYLLVLPREGSTERGISKAILGTPLAPCKCRGSQAASTLSRMVPSTPHPLHTRETEAQGSNTTGTKATANQEGTEPKRHQIPGPKLIFYSTLPSEQSSGRLYTRWWVRQGGKGEGKRFVSYLYIKSK